MRRVITSTRPQMKVKESHCFESNYFNLCVGSEERWDVKVGGDEEEQEKNDFMQNRFNYHLFRLEWQTKVKISPNLEATSKLLSVNLLMRETTFYTKPRGE